MLRACETGGELKIGRLLLCWWAALAFSWQCFRLQGLFVVVSQRR
jgi:hypothetical protein